MAKIFLIRHAESVANTAGIYQGQSYDTDLSVLGRKQAAALQYKFRNTKFDAVYSSPLKRTFHTAFHPSGGKSGGKVLAEPLLLETNHGNWEGKSKIQIKKNWPKEFNLWLTNPSQVHFPGGENFIETQKRAVNWFKQVASTSHTIAAFTHSNIIMSLICFIQNEPLDAMWQYAMQPTAVTLIESHSPAKIIYLNDISHLDDLKSDLSSHAF